MSQNPSLLLRATTFTATAALAMTGIVLIGPAATAAPVIETVSGTDIRPDETSYLGWHEGYANDVRAFSVRADGLHLGDGANSQVLNGLVRTGGEGLDASGIRALVEAALVEVESGDVYFQLPVTWSASGWSTLRSLVSDGGDVTTNPWMSSKDLGDIVGGTPVAFESIMDELAEQGNARYSGFGVLAMASSSPAVVDSIAWDDVVYDFAPAPVAVTSNQIVTSHDIVGNEATYLGWHEGYENPTRSFSVDSSGLHLGDPSDSQILNGFVASGAQGIATTNLGRLIESSSVAVTEGAVHLQVPVSWATGWSTLRSAAPASGTIVPALTDPWISSKPLGTIAANTPVALGDLLDELHAQTNVRYSGFGVLATSAATVTSIVFDGVQSTFAPYSVSPVSSTTTVSGHDIRGNEATYEGWHEGYKDREARAYSVETDGLHLGDGEFSQILNGMVAHGESTPISSSDLAKLIASASVAVTSGSVHLQVPVKFGASGWTTIRSAVPATDDAEFGLDSVWTTSKPIPAVVDRSAAIAAGAEVPLGDILDALHAQTNLSYSGYGILATDSTVVESITWGGVQTIFLPFAADAVTKTATVSGYDIAPNEDVYKGWHEGYDNDLRAYSVKSDGLHLGVGSDSQILNGLVDHGQALDISSTELGKLIAGSVVEATSGDIHLQVPVKFGTGSGWSTIRSNTPETGIVTFDLDSDWTTSKVIPAVANVSLEIPANAVRSLGTILDALHAQKNVRYSGYGILAQDEALVKSISWGDTKTTFVPFSAPGVGAEEGVTVHDIAPDESEYLGWHEGYANDSRSDSVDDLGLHLGDAEWSQILNGLVETGQPGFSTTAADLGKLIEGAEVTVTEGGVHFQVAVTFGATGWATLRPATAASGDVGFQLTDEWTSTKPINGVTSGTLADLLDALAAEGNVAYSGFGVLATAPAVVENIIFDGTQYNFVEFDSPAQSGAVDVSEADIAPDETSYAGWHEGYSNATPAYSVRDDGLRLGDGASSQILNGLVESGQPGLATTTSALGKLIEGASIAVLSGDVHFQVPISYTGGWATLRPATPAGAGTAEFDLTDQWISSRPINGITTGTLGDLLDAIAANGDMRYSGFGVLATDSAVVESVLFDGIVYNFTDSIVPGAPAIAPSPAPQVGVQLTLVDDADNWSAEKPISLNYQWLRNGAAIAGATGMIYTPGADDLGKTLAVRVTGNSAGYTTVTVATGESAIVAAGDMAPGVVAVIGTAKVGSALKAAPTGWGDSTLSYQWLRDGVAISGAIGMSYTAVAADFAEALTVTVTGTRGGYTDTTATSPATAAVAVGVFSAGTVAITGTAKVGVSLGAATTGWGDSTLSFQWLRDGAAITGATGASYTPDAADYAKALTVKVTAVKYGYANATATSAATADVIKDEETARLSGGDRFATSVAISQEYAPGVSRVYVANGMGYADGLSAAPAAAHFDSPLLLTKPGALPAAVRAEIVRLNPDEIVVVGGTGAVSAAVLNSLRPLADTVRRVEGADRYATSRAIARDAFGTDGASTAYIATGVNFPDALAASPAAAHFDGPVILVRGYLGALDIATTALLVKLGIDEVKIAGGTAIVSQGIATSLKASYTVERHWGADRYATAAAINQDAFSSSTKVYIANGTGFADALSGAALAGYADAPLYVSPAGCMPASVIAGIERLGATEIILLGGAGVLGSGVKNLLAC